MAKTTTIDLCKINVEIKKVLCSHCFAGIF